MGNMIEQERRERVVTGLETCEMSGTREDCEGYGCPYFIYNDEVSDECLMTLFNEALALLKAQEPVAPVLDIDTWKCGNCGHTLEHQQLLGDNVLFHEQYNYWFRQMKMIPPEQKCFHAWLLEPIPADIAQKHGIEPKDE